MFWEEKIDVLKKIYPDDQFRVPFTTWPDVCKKVEQKFIVKEWPYHENDHWSGKLKKETPIKTLPWQALDAAIENLESASHYWVVIVFGNFPATKQYVYDCQVLPMRQLISIAPADFYIVDKKYDWLVYFKVDHKKKEVFLSKSGDWATPFDEK